jgi:hypothetical protein
MSYPERELTYLARRWIFDALPYLARQLSVFNRLPTVYPRW